MAARVTVDDQLKLIVEGVAQRHGRPFGMAIGGACREHNCARRSGKEKSLQPGSFQRATLTLPALHSPLALLTPSVTDVPRWDRGAWQLIIKVYG
jgi:hypothetical protein